MRKACNQELLKIARDNPRVYMILADIGYGEIEEFANTFPDRFINCGVAEQNMTGVACGVAMEGNIAITYSIANFPTLRCLEQVRNDVCYHNANVKIVIIGGGMAYGELGISHHSTEDLAIMRALPNLRIYLPLVAADVEPIVGQMADDPLPNYLRLNTGARIPGELPAFAPWRRLKHGRRCVAIGMGPVVGNLFEIEDQGLRDDLEIWSVGTLPLAELPAELVASIRDKRRVVCIEEHYRSCGLAEALSHRLLTEAVIPEGFTSLHAAGYPSGRYGSQRWHQEESGLAGEPLRSRLREVVDG